MRFATVSLLLLFPAIAAGQDVRIKVKGLKDDNLKAFAEKVKAVKALPAEDAKEKKPVVKDVKQKDGVAVLTLHDKMPLYLSALDAALKGSDFSIERKTLAFNAGFHLKISGMV